MRIAVLLIPLISFLSLYAIEYEPIVTVTSTEQGLVIHHIYGTYIITDPLLQQLIQHPIMERIKKVHQYGVNYHCSTPYPYSRFDHCIGVFLILLESGCSYEECIAGLLHDVSHTVFSHVGDHLFKHESAQNSYQDDIHEWFLEQYNLNELLMPYGLTIKDILAKNPDFTALDQPNGILCADRIDYNLMGGLREHMLSINDIHKILRDLQYQNGTWFFTNPLLARRFATVPLYHTQHIWRTPHGFVIYEWTAQALQQALNIGLLAMDDIYFGTDDQVWHVLSTCSDPIIQALVTKILHYKRHWYLGSDTQYDTVIYTKFMGIDPLVRTEAGFYRLTQIDPLFARMHTVIKERVQNGWHIAFID